eukprot:453531-Rhodomonas_salina.1
MGYVFGALPLLRRTAVTGGWEVLPRSFTIFHTISLSHTVHSPVAASAMLRTSLRGSAMRVEIQEQESQHEQQSREESRETISVIASSLKSHEGKASHSPSLYSWIRWQTAPLSLVQQLDHCLKTMQTPSLVTWRFLPEQGHDCANSSPSCTAVPHLTCFHSVLYPEHPDYRDSSYLCVTLSLLPSQPP